MVAVAAIVLLLKESKSHCLGGIVLREKAPRPSGQCSAIDKGELSAFQNAIGQIRVERFYPLHLFCFVDARPEKRKGVGVNLEFQLVFKRIASGEGMSGN